MTSAIPVQCSNQLSYEMTQWRAGQFVGLMFSRERKNFFHMTLLSRESARIISSFDFKHRTAHNTTFLSEEFYVS